MAQRLTASAQQTAIRSALAQAQAVPIGSKQTARKIYPTAHNTAACLTPTEHHLLTSSSLLCAKVQRVVHHMAT